MWAPGPRQSGTAADKLGVVYDFAQIDFTPGASNIIDAALAEPTSSGDIDPAIDNIGNINGVNFSLTFGDKVKKTGAMSGYTTGKYRFEINAQIEYANGNKPCSIGCSASLGIPTEGTLRKKATVER